MLFVSFLLLFDFFFFFFESYLFAGNTFVFLYSMENTWTIIDNFSIWVGKSGKEVFWNF